MVRVASFNIRNGLAFDGWNSWPFRRRATARTIEDLDADIVGLQEVYGFQLRWLQRQLPRYTVVAGQGRNGGGRGEMCPLLVRPSAAKVSHATTRWYGDSPEAPASRLPGASSPRIATLANLRLEPSGVAVQVLSTHFDEAIATNRVRSARQVLDWLDRSTPHIVLGDLNGTPDDGAVEVLLRGGLESALRPEDGGTAHRFTGRRDGRQIDYVLFSKHWDVRSPTVDVPHRIRRLPSDHWPVVADLDLRPGGSW